MKFQFIFNRIFTSILILVIVGWNGKAFANCNPGYSYPNMSLSVSLSIAKANTTPVSTHFDFDASSLSLPLQGEPIYFEFVHGFKNGLIPSNGGNGTFNYSSTIGHNFSLRVVPDYIGIDTNNDGEDDKYLGYGVIERVTIPTTTSIIEPLPVGGGGPECIVRKIVEYDADCTLGNSNFIEIKDVFHQRASCPGLHKITNKFTLSNVGNRTCEITTSERNKYCEVIYDNHSTNMNRIAPTQEKSMSTKIYPNPVSDSFTIQGSSEVKDITLFDLTGKRVETEVSYSTNGAIVRPIQNLNSGVYMVQYNTNGESEHKKIIFSR